MIAHRPSSVEDAEAIVVLDEGRVGEGATHEESVAADGLYATLWGVQAGKIESLPDDLLARTAE